MSNINELVYNYLLNEDFSPIGKTVEYTIRGLSHIPMPSPYKAIIKGHENAIKHLSSSNVDKFDFNKFKFSPNSPVVQQFLKDHNLKPNVVNTPGFKSLFYDYLQNQNIKPEADTTAEYIAAGYTSIEKAINTISDKAEEAQKAVEKLQELDLKGNQKIKAVTDTLDNSKKAIDGIVEATKETVKQSPDKAKKVISDADETLTKINKDPSKVLDYLQEFYHSHKSLIAALGIVSGLGLVYKWLSAPSKPKQVQYQPTSRVPYYMGHY